MSYVTLLDGVAATTSAPTLATDGVDLRRGNGTPGQGLRELDYAMLCADVEATGALTFQGVVWVYSNDTAKWYPLGTSTTVANRGKLNRETTLTGTDSMTHSELIQGLSAFDRVALQVTTLTGTDAEANARLVAKG